MSEDYARIAEAIRYLDQHYREQPNLDELAAHLHLSPAHLQRIFRRWAGISPKRFVQYLTIEHAKEQLSAAQSVLHTAYDAGLSGPGRLHDLFVNVEAMTPGEFKRRGAGLEIDYGIHDSPFGDCLLATTDRGICALQFLESGSSSVALAALQAQWPAARFTENGRKTHALLQTIFPVDPVDGARTVTLHLQGTNFQLKVWQALLRIPAGLVCTYGDVATLVGQPGAARAVGSAVGRNAIGYLIPCHRVIRSNGTAGDYRWGHVRKQAMLGWEAGQAEPLPARS